MRKLLVFGLCMVLLIITACSTTPSGDYSSISDCVAASEEDKKECFKAIAPDIDDCAKIEISTIDNLIDAQYCQSASYNAAAEQSSYSSVDECLQLSKENDFEHTTEIEVCYLAVAQKTKDSSVCDSINAGHEGDADYNRNLERCYGTFISVAKDTNDMSRCEMMDDTSTYDWREKCFLSIAHERRDVDMCGDNNGCISNIAIMEEDETICLAIPADVKYQSRHLCVLNVAFRKDDVSVCEILTDEQKRVNCIAGFKETKGIDIDYSELIGNKYVEVLPDTTEIRQPTNAAQGTDEATLIINNIGDEDITVFATTEVTSELDTSYLRCAFGMSSTKSRDYTIKAGEGIRVPIHLSVGQSEMGGYDCKVAVPSITGENSDVITIKVTESVD